ncbi:hypothetical protein [Bacillus sp. Marseille-Q3570]|uniref:hypothetical protein n=1 Tax=Bacillus sp. Marseille-Q3570 TaxID=2963522 RepID=UPI0021B7351E|nr:hypothetical protein [Bacillus sp. Marseille-Q3570]
MSRFLRLGKWKLGPKNQIAQDRVKIAQAEMIFAQDRVKIAQAEMIFAQDRGEIAQAVLKFAQISKNLIL